MGFDELKASRTESSSIKLHDLYSRVSSSRPSLVVQAGIVPAATDVAAVEDFVKGLARERSESRRGKNRPAPLAARGWVRFVRLRVVTTTGCCRRA